MRELLSVEQYQAELRALVQPGTAFEVVALRIADRLVLAQAVTSPVAVPGFDNSAMDGYAVRFTEAGVGQALSVVGEVPAGSAADPDASPGQCVRIMTGAPLPSFADTVVPVEDADTLPPPESGEPDSIVIRKAPARLGAHIRRAGEDFLAGAVLAEPGVALTPALLGALASTGVQQVAVRPRPVVAVAATGDELVSDGATLQRGQIHESNSLALAATLRRDGAEVVLASAPIPDQEVALRNWLDTATTQADLVVLTGGASVGDFDVAREVLTAAGGHFRHVRMQPGKPQGWALWNDTLVLSLPGNPVSALVSYLMFGRPLLDRILGRATPAWFPAVAGTSWSSPPGRRQLLPVRLATDPDGRLTATPAHRRGSASHLVTSLALADGLAAVGEEVTDVEAGDPLVVQWL